MEIDSVVGLTQVTDQFYCNCLESLKKNTQFPGPLLGGKAEGDGLHV